MEDAKILKEKYEPKQSLVVGPDFQVTAARFSPCGRFLIGAGFDAKLHRWRVPEAAPAEPAAAEAEKNPDKNAQQPTLEALAPIAGHNGWVTSLAFHPDRERLFSVDSWGRLACWKYADEAPQPLWQVEAAHAGFIRDVAVSPDGSKLASCGRDGFIRLWATADGAKQAELAGHNEDVHSVRFHPAEAALVSGDLKGAVIHWDLSTGKLARRFDAAELYALSRDQEVGGAKCLRFSPDGMTLAAAGTRPKNGGTVQGTPLLVLFDWKTGQVAKKLEFGATSDVYVFDLEFHPAGFLMVVTCGGPGNGKFLYQRIDDKEPFFVTTQMANCQSLSVHPDGRRIAVAATNRGSNGNGRPLDKDGNYLGNTSPIHVFEMANA
ncbi:MAG: hypothetical protein KY476_09365 [Planctomycetes bacterium]|nr:hypothetical protein [Planctomycetota bacterium]